jgi:cytoskeletal protein CcmA (bactofilin family)
MFGKKVESIKLEENAVDCLISASTRVDGNVTFAGGLRVDGTVIGNVTVANGERGTLIISERARVDGAVIVCDAIVNGTINGAITATGCLQLEPSARVEGDITYSKLEMFPGAIVCGRLMHIEEITVPSGNVLPDKQPPALTDKHKEEEE